MINSAIRNGIVLAFAALLVCVPRASNSEPGQDQAYPGEGAIYATADRMEQYHFLAHLSEYSYTHPLKPVSGQTFEADAYDTPPTAAVHNCSNALVRCVALDTQAFAVPRARLAPADTYVANGNKFTVEACLRGYKNVCQVALVRAECYFNRIRMACAPTGAERTGDDASWLLYFIYNEDFGVTCYGIKPLTGKPVSREEMMAAAKQNFLVGNYGLLGP